MYAKGHQCAGGGGVRSLERALAKAIAIDNQVIRGQHQQQSVRIFRYNQFCGERNGRPGTPSFRLKHNVAPINPNFATLFRDQKPVLGIAQQDRGFGTDRAGPQQRGLQQRALIQQAMELFREQFP